MKQPQRNGTAKKDAKRGNRRERKLEKQKKELRQWIARRATNSSEGNYGERQQNKRKRNLKATESTKG